MKKLTWCVLMVLALRLVTYASPIPLPSWWTGIIGGEENNYAPANLGQLKYIATQAREHLDQALASHGGAGGAIDNIVDFPPAPLAPLIENYAPINLGQLKNVAKPFYQRLRQMGFDTNRNLKDYGYPSEWSSVFPWLESTPPAENYLPANIGQLKAVFAFEYIPTLIPPDAENRDSDGDGIADVDEPAGDVDGDGLENWEDADRDNDGTNDDADFFPDDDRRSENIPVKYYGVIDLSQYRYPDGEPAAATDAKHIAINDDGKVSWVTSEQSQDGSMSYTISKWNNGALLNPETLHDFSHTTNSEDGQSIQELIHNITNLNGDGTWIGSIIDSNYAEHFSTEQPATGHWQRVRGMPGHLAVPPSLLLSFDPPLMDPEDNYPYVDGNGGNKVIVEHVTPAGTPIGSIIYNIRDDGDYRAVTRVFRGSPDGPYSHPVALNERWYIYGISSAGDVLLSRSSEVNVDLNGDADTLWDSSGTVTHLGRVGARSVNAQRQVVGTQTVSGYVNGVPTNFNGNDPRGELGFLWENGQLTTFHDLLPERFRNQLRSAVPYLITNVDQTLNSPYIVFRAKMLTTLSSGDVWVVRDFLWWKESDGTPQIRTISWPAGQQPSITAINAGLMVAAMGADGKPNAGMPVSFSSSAIEKGFDPPLPGDADPDGNKDSDNPEWWTSVCKESVTGEGIDGNLQINEHIVILFEKDAHATLCEVILAPVSRNLIDMEVLGGMKKETKLKITGKTATDQDIQNAEIAIYPSAGLVNGATGREPKPGVLPLATLRVMVMPKIELKLGIWAVQHPEKPQTSLVAASDPLKALQATNRAFRQACVVFKAVQQADVPVSSGVRIAPDGKVIVDAEYDTAPTENNALDAGSVPPDGLWREIYVVQQRIPKIAEANLAWVRFKTRDPMITQQQRDPISYCGTSMLEQGFQPRIDAFYLECAHEVGHQFDLSTRSDPSRGGTSGHNHDPGQWPYPKVGTPPTTKYGLMRAGEKNPDATAWLRHEDWKKASETARDKKGKTNWVPKDRPVSQ